MADEATAVGLESIRTPVNSLDEVGAKLAEFAIGGNAGILISTDAVLFDWRRPAGLGQHPIRQARRFLVPIEVPIYRPAGKAGAANKF
jgi:hypothetical protein